MIIIRRRRCFEQQLLYELRQIREAIAGGASPNEVNPELLREYEAHFQATFIDHSDVVNNLDPEQ